MAIKNDVIITYHWDDSSNFLELCDIKVDKSLMNGVDESHLSIIYYEWWLCDIGNN